MLDESFDAVMTSVDNSHRGHKGWPTMKTRITYEQNLGSNMDRVIHPPLSEHNRLRQPLTQGERKVLEVFMDTLPIEWEIYVQPHLNGKRPDFVLLHPRIGIAVFEVKDWDLDAMEYFTKRSQPDEYLLCARKDGRTFPISNPIKQVNNYRNLICDIYCPRLDGKIGYAAVTAGIIFPNASKSKVENLLEHFRCEKKYRYREPISGFDELNRGKIAEIFPDSDRKSSRIMRKEIAEDLRGWLVEPDFAKVQRQPLNLNDRQWTAATTRTNSGRRHITGPAGSGKSLVVAARAAHLANEGKNVLVATFNITLWHYLRDLIVRNLRVAKNLSNIEMTHFHAWCKDVCYENGYDFEIAQYQKLFDFPDDDEQRLQQVLNQELPALIDRLIENRGTQLFDAILIDEGQDYLPSWIKTLAKACKPGGEILFVSDDTQNVYGTAQLRNDNNMREAGFYVTPYHLKLTYRLGPATAALARNFAQSFLPNERCDLPIPAQGSLDLEQEHLKWVQANKGNGPLLCSEELLSFMKRTGRNSAANSDATILTEDMKSGELICDLLKNRYSINTRNTYGEDHRSKKMAFFMGDAAIKATTIHSFKGWESRLIIVYVTDAESEEALATIYTGLTRLRQDPEGSWMTIICSSPSLRDFGKSFPEFIDISTSET